MREENIILQALDLYKYFGGVKAVDGISTEIYKGEIVGFVGENGAGKSTLVKLFISEYRKDSGSLRFNGKDVHWKSSHDALLSGVGLVHQKPELVPDLSAAENIFLGKEITKNSFLQTGAINREANKLLERYPINKEFDLKTKALAMSPAQRVITEILKVLSYDPELLILDEPTASLTKDESEVLLSLITDLNKEKGISVIFISHRLEEVFGFVHRIEVFRNGKSAGKVEKENFDKDKIIHMIINRNLEEFYPPKAGRLGDNLLRVTGLESNKLKDINITVCAGEIVGLYGLSGAGMTEVVESVFGLSHIKSGSIIINDKEFRNIHVSEMIDKKIYLIPEDRDKKGLFSNFSVGENLTIAHLKTLLPDLFIGKRKEKNISIFGIEKFDIKCASVNQEISTLSGGNQQKVLIARWLMKECNVLMLDDPTVGVDIGTKREIYLILRKIADEGNGIILVSSDILEIIGLADKVYTMREGRVTSELKADEITQNNILQAVL